MKCFLLVNVIRHTRRVIPDNFLRSDVVFPHLAVSFLLDGHPSIGHTEAGTLLHLQETMHANCKNTDLFL